MGPAFQWEECRFATISSTTWQFLIVVSAVKETNEQRSVGGCVGEGSFNQGVREYL